MKVLYFDCLSGISGDMTIAALLDAGADFRLLRDELKKLPLQGEYNLHYGKVIKNGISSAKFDVILNPGHDELHSSHEHKHVHSHHEHHHRSYRDIVEMIDLSSLSEQVKELSKNIFRRIGEAEGKIHGVELADVHFHEVGAIDSIIDIVGTAIAITEMDIEHVVASPIPVGGGYVHIDHGIYPVPAPATLEILRGLPIKETDIQGELTTPTGAGIIHTLAKSFGPMPSMKIEQVGYGAGSKTFSHHPNVLRVVVGSL